MSALLRHSGHHSCGFRSHKRVDLVIQGSRLGGISIGDGSRILTQCSSRADPTWMWVVKFRAVCK